MDGTLMPQNYTIEDAPASTYTVGDDTNHADALARVAQPTQFEKASAARGDSATPAMDTLRGFGQGLMNRAALVGRGIHAIPEVGPALIPSQGLAAEQQMSIPRTPGEKLGNNIESIGEAALPVGELFNAAKGSRYVAPIASKVSEYALPFVSHIPGVKEAMEAPTMVKAALTGAGKGAAFGAAGGAATSKLDPYETAKGALYGALTGGIAGAGAYGIGRLANQIPTAAEAFVPMGPTRVNPEHIAELNAEKPFVPQGPTRVNPAHIQELNRPQIPTAKPEPFELTPPPQPTEQAIQQQMEFPQEIPAQAASAVPAQIPAGRVGPPMQRLGELIEQGAGTPQLQPNAPLREQRQLQKPFGNRAAVEVSELHGPRTVAPEQIPQAIPNAVDQAMGGNLTPEAAEKARLQEKYPDAGDRQAIHRTSEKVFEATRDNPDLRKALGDLPAHDNKGGPDLARAAANLGEDLGERRIGNKKAEWMGAGQINRDVLFDRLLDKGYTAQEILDAAHAEPQSIPTLAKPGPMKAARPIAREKAGD
jgi:hypothetical protein